MKILFLHGWTSVPGGRKPTFLESQGHEVINPALPADALINIGTDHRLADPEPLQAMVDACQRLAGKCPK